MCVAPKRTENNCRQSHHRADRKVDAASDDDGCQRKRQQSHFNTETSNLKRI